MKQDKFLEKFLYEIWKNRNFSKELTTNDEQTIKILDAGTENKETGGPDFKHARIQIGNLTYSGDVEIDGTHSDWKSHGHHLNKKYNSVILHVVFNNSHNDACVYTQDGRKVQSFSLEPFLDENVRKKIQQAILSERSGRINKMPCAELNNELDEKEKLDFVYSLGIERFKQKCEKVLLRLKELVYLKEVNLREPVVNYEPDKNFYQRIFTAKDFDDTEIWEQLIYESMFEALGFSKNKDIMRRLSASVELKYLKKFVTNKDFIALMEAIYFNISGLIPPVEKIPDEETSEYVKKMVELWVINKNGYDGKMFHSNQWNFSKLRPYNFPTVRIAGGVRLLCLLLRSGLIPAIIKEFESFNNNKKIINSLRSYIVVKGEGFWHNHYTFEQASNVKINYFVGVSRADEIIVNVLLPVFSVYFDLFNRKEISRKVLKIYLNYYQQSENSLVNEVAETLNLGDAWKRSVFYQGMIDLFRNYCSKNNCLECSIGKKVFG
ncbi:MAG TPA: DUF2851 family protein [Ignavibacteriaceae bacterium]|nr:DUF2851 family protein [Ignavibacteriaceae bacterium]